MKIYLLRGNDMHHKNIESIRNMTRYNGAVLVEGQNLGDVDDSFDYVMCNDRYVPPEAFPSKTCKIIYGPQFLGVPPVPPNHPVWSHKPNPRTVSNALSPWVRDLFKRLIPVIPHEDRPFGIDMSANTQVGPNRSNIVVYYKNRRQDQVQYVINELSKRNITPNVFSYGSYQDHDFKNTLENTKFVIWVGCHESQGFAFQETLAKNVPVLVWEVRSMCDEFNRGNQVYFDNTWVANTASSWSEECGLRFWDQHEFSAKLDYMIEHYSEFTPRAFIERELSLGPTFRKMFPK